MINNQEKMGVCASKPKVLEGAAPHVAEEDIKQEEIVGDDVPNKPHALSNLFKEVFLHNLYRIT